jgi:hypothetical protein
VRPEVAGVGDSDSGIRSGELLALAADAFLEDSGEEEVGEDGDSAGAQLLQSLQPLGDGRGGHADVGVLHRRVRASLVEEACDLGEVRVGIWVRRTASYDEDGGLLSLHFGDGGRNPFVHQLQQLGTDAESAAVPKVDSRVAHLLAHQGRGYVVLGVAGGEEHQGNRGYASRPALHEAAHALGDRGPRELYETTLDRE